MESAEYLRGYVTSLEKGYASALDKWDALDSYREKLRAAELAAAQATPEEDLGTAPPKRSGTIKVTLTRGGSGKPLECGEGDEPEGREGATWELVKSLESALARIRCCHDFLHSCETCTGILDDSIGLIAEARKGGK